MLKPKGKAVKLHVWRQFKVYGQKLEATTLRMKKTHNMLEYHRKKGAITVGIKRILLLQKYPQP